jgi:Flp pilus assembly protein TadG
VTVYREWLGLAALKVFTVVSLARGFSRLRGAVSRFTSAERGGVALLVALALPPLLLVSLGAIQLQSVFNDRSRSQNVADAAALWGAQQLTVTPVGADSRAKAFAETQLVDMAANATVTVSVAVLGDSTMKVAVDTHRPSFFFNLLPLGGFHTHAEAVAEGVSQTPLCVITFGVNASSHKMEFHGGSRLTAPACLVHANERIEIEGTAQLSANAVQTGASASGPITPSANTGAPDVTDPFADLAVPDPGLLCPVVGLLTPFTVSEGQTRTLPAGCHGKVEVKSDGTLNLEAGEHIFAQDFELKNSARLRGDDVVLVFASAADAKWKDGASVILAGRKSGALAGFVLVTARNRSGEFKLETNPIDEMTGTIYVPNAELTLEGEQNAAQASDWTVMAVQKLHLHGSPVVQINANYNGSDVPVPSGVGNKTSSDFTKLTQ